MESRTVVTNGNNLHFVEEGTGPAVLLCHGFPETWRSWRRQIHALSEAGFRVIAPDMRGYGGSSRPEGPAAYSMPQIAADLVGLLDALAIQSACIVGHDWGATAAWNAALMHPERFNRVAGLSVAYIPRGAVDLLEQLRQGHEHFYMTLFQHSGANLAMKLDVALTLKYNYYTASGTTPEKDRFHPYSSVLGMLTIPPTELPAWLDSDDFASAVSTFKETGFEGGLNWYRAIPTTFSEMAAFQDAPVKQPSLFLYGAKDAIQECTRPWIDALPHNLPGLVVAQEIAGAGHWLQQEAPEAVNAALLKFLRA